jgi:hypothetical protein
MAISAGTRLGPYEMVAPLSTYYAAVGEPDAMFEALEEAYRQRSRELVNIRQMWLMDQYHIDPRHQALLAKMNLT